MSKPENTDEQISDLKDALITELYSRLDRGLGKRDADFIIESVDKLIKARIDLLCATMLERIKHDINQP